MKNNSIKNCILIADDDASNRLFLKKGTKGLPFELDFAVDGQDAWEKIQANEYDLLLLDIQMPKMTGFEVLEKLNEVYPQSNIPVLFMTGSTDHKSINKGFELGAVDYITKPYNMHEVRHRLQIHHDLYKSRKEIDLFAQEMETLAEGRAQQLLHADRLVTLGTMSAGIMHEINNPTTFISGNVQLLKNKYLPIIEKALKESPDSGDRKIQFILRELPKMCEGILNGVVRIKKITDGLKSFSRSLEDGKEIILLSKIIDNALFFCKSSIPKSVELECINDENLLKIHGDSQKIEQVLINLIINSSHAMEDKESPKVTISTTVKDKFVKITISDNGTGIPENLLEKIWDPFFTTKAKGKGTGLGLSICREIVEGHEGTIEYDDAFGSGACFHISIPIYNKLVKG
jgi:signal transduction histidine kinase